MHEETWQKFKEARAKSGKSWNQYILDIIGGKRACNTKRKVLY